VKVVFEHAIPNIEGKRMVAQIVSYPPGGKSLPHRHAPSAFIYARVLSGAIRSQVGDEPAASLLAVIVLDSHDNPLFIPDQK
jgi:quercetin dioxygenase-like cupin family protein